MKELTPFIVFIMVAFISIFFMKQSPKQYHVYWVTLYLDYVLILTIMLSKYQACEQSKQYLKHVKWL